MFFYYFINQSTDQIKHSQKESQLRKGWFFIRRKYLRAALSDCIIIFDKMALFVELEQVLQVDSHRQRTAQPQPNIPFLSTLPNFLRQYQLVELTPLLPTGISSQSFSGRFAQRLPQGITAVYTMQVDIGEKKAWVVADLVRGESALAARSSEMVKNICRTVRTINSMSSKSLAGLMVSPQTGRLRVCLPGDISYNSPQTFFPLFRSYIGQAYNFLVSFLPLLLYCANLAPRSSLLSLPRSLHHLFFGPNGDLMRYAQIYQLLPCVNCPLESEEIGQGDYKNSSCKRVIQLYYDQWASGQQKEVEMYAEPPLVQPEQRIGSFDRNSLGLGFPSPRDVTGEMHFIFNTITVTNYNKQGQRFIAEGGRARIIASPTQFFYSKSFNPIVESSKNKKKQGEESTAQGEEPESEVSTDGGRQIEKMMLVKMPRVGPKDKDWRKLLDHIRYEKAILSNMRTVGCAYLPKYYHSVQKGYQYHPFLLMDHLQCNTLFEEMEKRSLTFSLSSKLHLLSHLSNAIRFLEQHSIAHLDITPSNILVVKDLLVKIIDFGEAYHKLTTTKLIQSAGKPVYSPGRTFPYAPPETSQRVTDFTSQQDMYSLGVILHLLIFGSYPFTCSSETYKQIYRNRTYGERMMLAPQRGEDYGQSEFMAVLINLCGKLMECDEKMRPYPVWAHLIIKKLFYAIR